MPTLTEPQIFQPEPHPMAQPAPQPPLTSDIYTMLKEILDEFDEDYERSSAAAAKYLKEAGDFQPYIRYLMIYAKAYRAWQISYHYTKIRSYSKIALDNLYHDQGVVSENKIIPHRELVEVFKRLTTLIDEGTWCENSFINNDPVALVEHSQKALNAEQEALSLLAKMPKQKKLVSHLLREALEELPKSKEAWVIALAEALKAAEKEINSDQTPAEEEEGDSEEKDAFELLEKALKVLKNGPPESTRAIEPAKQALERLSVDRLCTWATEYFKTNQRADTGRNACAKIYMEVFLHHCCPVAIYTENMQRAKAAIAELELEDAGEMISEINAHIVHIERHYKRLMEHIGNGQKPPTFLRLYNGKIVLALAAGCNSSDMRDLINGDISVFKEELSGKYKKLEIEPKNFHTDQLHDIFETSFGKKYLKSYSFELPNVRITFPSKTAGFAARSYLFDTQVTLSALGSCTLFFTLPLENCKGGLSVEEARALQSCICPHAGQVTVELVESNNTAAIERLSSLIGHTEHFDIVDYIDLGSLKSGIERLQEKLKKKKKDAGLREIMKSLFAKNKNDELQKILKTLSDWIEKWCAEGTEDNIEEKEAKKKTGRNSTSDHNSESSKFVEMLKKLVKWHSDTAADHPDSKMIHNEVSGLIQRLVSGCDIHNSLAVLARLFLNPIEDVFKEIATDLREMKKKKRGAEPVVDDWVFHSDIGWFTYLYPMRIDEMGGDPEHDKQRVSFKRIENHPDTPGLIIEQREARASFDDWRHVVFNLEEGPPNLAHVRSHDTDAFFISEYQAFLYLPDDPQFLTDQYEATVMLMHRLNTSLRYYNHVAQDLSHKVLDQLKQFKYGTMSGIHEEELRKSREAIQHLRSEAIEIQNLIAKADVSRYRDHGDLMTKIIEKMKIDKVCQLLDSHLNHLDELHSSIISRLEAKRKRRINNGIMLVSGILTALGVNSLVTAFYKIFGLSDSKDPHIIWLDGILTVSLTAIIWLFLIVLNYKLNKESS